MLLYKKIAKLGSIHADDGTGFVNDLVPIDDLYILKDGRKFFITMYKNKRFDFVWSYKTEIDRDHMNKWTEIKSQKELLNCIRQFINNEL